MDDDSSKHKSAYTLPRELSLKGTLERNPIFEYILGHPNMIEHHSCMTGGFYHFQPFPNKVNGLRQVRRGPKPQICNNPCWYRIGPKRSQEIHRLLLNWMVVACCSTLLLRLKMLKVFGRLASNSAGTRWHEAGKTAARGPSSGPVGFEMTSASTGLNFCLVNDFPVFGFVSLTLSFLVQSDWTFEWHPSPGAGSRSAKSWPVKPRRCAALQRMLNRCYVMPGLVLNRLPPRNGSHSRYNYNHFQFCSKML